MKPEEAIEILELPKDPLKSGTHYHAIPSPKRISCTDYLNARKAAIQALEKQVPKNPVELLTGDGAQMIILCGNCEEEVADNWKGCPHCLTIIDWSDE